MSLAIRRRPLQLFLALAVCVSHVFDAGTSSAADSGQATLVIERPLGTSDRSLGVAELLRVFTEKQIPHTTANKLSSQAGRVLVIGIAGQSPTLDRLLEDHKLSVPSPAESLLVKQVSNESQQILLVAGRDDRGLTYALLELARTLELALPRNEGLTPRDDNWFALIPELRESPLLRTRSITMQLFNEELDSEWYSDEDFWRWYFTMLARNRCNNFSLTFAHQVNYMNPAYPWLLSVPEYPQVRVSRDGENVIAFSSMIATKITSMHCWNSMWRT